MSTAAEIAELPEEEQRAALAKGEKAIRKKADEAKARRREKRRREEAERKAEAAVDLPPRAERRRLLQGGILSAGGEVPDDSIDLIIRAPPSVERYPRVFGDLGDFAGRALKPGGSLLCVVDPSCLKTALLRLMVDLSY